MTGMHIDVETYHSYPLEVAGLKRDLPICRVSDSLYIAAFVIFGDVELTKACASELIKKLPPYDVLITAEAKGIPLVYEMARQLGDERYLIDPGGWRCTGRIAVPPYWTFYGRRFCGAQVPFRPPSCRMRGSPVRRYSIGDASPDSVKLPLE